MVNMGNMVKRKDAWQMKEYKPWFTVEIAISKTVHFSNKEWLEMNKSDTVSIVGRALASVGVLYFLPEIARATHHGILTLVFGVIAFVCIWAGA